LKNDILKEIAVLGGNNILEGMRLLLWLGSILCLGIIDYLEKNQIWVLESMSCSMRCERRSVASSECNMVFVHILSEMADSE
jgi:hypothetical protein